LSRALLVWFGHKKKREVKSACEARNEAAHRIKQLKSPWKTKGVQTKEKRIKSRREEKRREEKRNGH
jgi:hypothetical protein